MQPSPQLVLEHIHHPPPQKNPIPLSIHSSFPLKPPTLCNHSLFCLSGLSIHSISYQWTHIMCGPLWLTPLLVFKIHPCSNVSALFCCYYYWKPIVWMYPILFINSSAEGHLHCFHILDIRNNATMIIHVTSFYADNIFSFFLVIYLGVEFPGHLISMFNLSSSCQIIFQCAASFYIACSRIGSFSASPPTWVACRFDYYWLS